MRVDQCGAGQARCLHHVPCRKPNSICKVDQKENHTQAEMLADSNILVTVDLDSYF